MAHSYIGAFVVGTFINVLLFGISWSQSIQYISHCGTKPDRPIYKWAVAVLFLVGLLHTATSVVTVYDMTVVKFGDLQQMALCPWSFALDPVLTAIVAFIVQLFYAYRIWILSKRSWVVPVLVTLLTFLQLGVGIWCTIFAFMKPRWSAIATDLQPSVALWLFGMAAGDIVITLALVIYLQRAKTGFERTNSVIDRLIKHIIANNALTAFAATASSILFIAAPGVWHTIPGLVISRLYIVSFMSSLNSRSKLAEDLSQVRVGAAQKGGAGASSSLLPTFNIHDRNYDAGAAAAGAFRQMLVGRKDRTYVRKVSPLSTPRMPQTASDGSGRDYDFGSLRIPIQVTVESTSDQFMVESPSVWDPDKSSAYSSSQSHGLRDERLSPTLHSFSSSPPPFSNTLSSVPDEPFK